MKITVEFDLSTEEGKADFDDFKTMKRNARFWDELYEEVFRPKIKYSIASGSSKFSEVWAAIGDFMQNLEE